MYAGLDRPQDGINIHGLFIDAGRWDMNLNKLVDALPGLKYLYSSIIYEYFMRSDFSKILCRVRIRVVCLKSLRMIFVDYIMYT